MLLILVDANEGRDFATAEVTSAYLREDMDDVIFTGEFLYILCCVKPEYETLASFKNRIKVLYILLKKAMYCCVKFALLKLTYLHPTGFRLQAEPLQTLHGKLYD
jgi:hypothetical protein